MTESAADDIAARGLEDTYSQLAHLAETALLGGLLLRRGARERVNSWLRPEHFQSWTNGAIYQALLDHNPPPVGGDPDDDAQRPRTIAERVAAPGATPAYVSGLIDACPSIEHVAHYGRLVLRGAVRRAAGEDAIRLAQQATALDGDDPVAVRKLAATAESARRAAEVLASGATLTADVLYDRGRPADREMAPSEDEVTVARLAGGRAAVPMTEAMLRETGLLAAVIRRPAVLDEPEVRQLSPQIFTHRTCGALFAAAGALHDSGERLDELLVVAEADTVRPWSDGFGPVEARDALAVSGTGSASHLAAQILNHAARDAALRAAEQLQASALGVPEAGAEAMAETVALPTEVALSAPARRQHVLVGEPDAATEPTAAPLTPPGPRPVVVFVAGDPVATGAASVLIRDALARPNGSPVTLGRGFPPDHPLYELVATSGAPDALGRYQAAEAHVAAARLDTVIHTRASDPQALAAAMRRFHAAGFRVEVAAVPTSEPESRLSALDAQLQQHPDRQPPAHADHRVAEALALVEDQHLAHTVTVFRPNGQALYTNHAEQLDDGTRRWRGVTATSRVAAHEIGRTWTAEESVRFTATHARVIAQAGPKADRALQTIAAQAAAHHPDDRWQAGIAVATQAIAPPPPAGSRAGARIRSAGPVASLTDQQLDAELLQTLRNHHHAKTAAQRAADRAASAQTAADGGGGSIADRLRTAESDPELIARTLRAATEDAAYLAAHATRIDARTQGLLHHAGALLRETNRRAQLTPQQHRQEDWIRRNGLETRTRDEVHRGPAIAGSTADSATQPRMAARPRNSGVRPPSSSVV